jgi:hypothetical protein
VPSSHLADKTIEYYPDLHQYSVVELAGEHVLINRKKDKLLEIQGNLEFHGGLGATLVMRLFSQTDLERKLRAAGFADVALQLDAVDRFGIAFEGPWSRPLVARKQPFPKLTGSDARLPQLYRENAALKYRLETVETQLRLAAGSRWLKLGRRLGFGPNLE